MSIIERETETKVAPAVTTRDVLHRAADLLEEFGWTQRAEARTADGTSVIPNHKDAVSFCLYGAVGRAQIDLGLQIDYAKAAMMLDDPGAFFLAGWNNAPERNKTEVVARLREAAEASA